MTFKELRDALNNLSEDELEHQVTAFSKTWPGVEANICLDYDQDGHYLYVFTKRELNDILAAK